MCKPRMVHVCTYHPPIHFIALTAIPVLSPVLFMPSLYYTSYNSKIFFIITSSSHRIDQRFATGKRGYCVANHKMCDDKTLKVFATSYCRQDVQP